MKKAVRNSKEMIIGNLNGKLANKIEISVEIKHEIKTDEEKIWITVTPHIDPYPAVKGKSTGHGEGLSYQGKLYFYRCPLRIPKNKIAVVTWEGNWCGRTKGERNHLVLVWNGKNFTVVEEIIDGCLRRDFAKYKGAKVEDAVKIYEADRKKKTAWMDNMPKCEKCGKLLIILDEEDEKHPKICRECYKPLSI